MPRKKGSLNQSTRETKEFLNLVVKNEHAHIEAALLDLFQSNKASYLHAITKLLPFITPKARETNMRKPGLPSKTPNWFDDKSIVRAASRM